MKKILYFLIVFSIPSIFYSCSNEELSPDSFCTRSVESWFPQYDAAYDGFWETILDNDADAELLNTTNWLPRKIKEQFIGALWEGGSTVNNPEYPWEKTAYVVKEVLSWGGDEGKKPTKIRYTLWALEIGIVNGKEMFRYIVPETMKSYYTVEFDPYE